MDRRPRWCDDARDRLVDVSDAAWEWATTRIDERLPLRALTRLEARLARADAATLAVALDADHAGGERLWKLLLGCRYGGRGPRPREARPNLRFRARRDY